MRHKTIILAALALSVAHLALADGVAVRRIFREPRVTRGNTNIVKVQPVDWASWIWSPKAPGTCELAADWEAMTRDSSAAKDGVFLKFRKRFSAKPDAKKLTIDVSADERFYLTLDGAFVARGPNRAVVENWQYQTYEIDLTDGDHVLEATVWIIGDHGPLAQLSFRGGFVLKADGAYDAVLTTGKADWEVGTLHGMKAIGKGSCWGTGDQWEVTGTGIYDAEPATWTKAVVVRGPAGVDDVKATYGGRTGGWMLFPTQLPDQTETMSRPGAVKAVTRNAKFREEYAYTEAETKAPEIASLNALVREGRAYVVPPHTRLQAAWDLGVYCCAYPQLVVKGGAGAKVAWGWTEASRQKGTGLKGGQPGARDAIVGRYLEGYGDTFVCDGRDRAVFSSPWFRCGKWCRIDVETGDQPLEITDLYLVESRYPLEMESAFATPQDVTMDGIRRISARAMQMCCHETLYDCPYYEQQMYPGDTRVQLNVLTAMTRDDRIIKRAIELYDLSTRDDGQCPFNWPTRGTQEGATYTLCYLLMYGDYVMNHADRAWLKARLPGLRKTMAGMELYENADGLLENMPGWQFMDWVVGWRQRGLAPGGAYGEGVNAEANLFWALAMRSAALTERALGNELQARYWEEKSAKLKAKIVETFWCAERGILADTPAMKDFSEHAQCLAIVGDVLPADKERTCFEHLIADADLKRTTVYFNFYLFEAYFKMGRADLFQKRLDLWRTYVAKGLTTTQEAPDSGKNGQQESRSDCHAWGGHPIWFMQTGLAGIRSAAPFFEQVLVAPCPGTLKELTAKHPHPQGFVDVSLKFDNGKVSGTVKTPVPGMFRFGDQVVSLKAGENAIR